MISGNKTVFESCFFKWYKPLLTKSSVKSAKTDSKKRRYYVVMGVFVFFRRNSICSLPS